METKPNPYTALLDIVVVVLCAFGLLSIMKPVLPGNDAFYGSIPYYQNSHEAHVLYGMCTPEV